MECLSCGYHFKEEEKDSLYCPLCGSDESDWYEEEEIDDK